MKPSTQRPPRRRAWPPDWRTRAPQADRARGSSASARGAPLDVVPHVGGLHRLVPERDVVLQGHDVADVERAPAECHAGRPRDIGKLHDAEIALGASDGVPEIDVRHCSPFPPPVRARRSLARRDADPQAERTCNRSGCLPRNTKGPGISPAPLAVRSASDQLRFPNSCKRNMNMLMKSR